MSIHIPMRAANEARLNAARKRYREVERLLARGPRTLDALAALLRIGRPAAQQLAYRMQALGLVVRSGARYAPTYSLPSAQRPAETPTALPRRYCPEFKPLKRDFDQHRRLAMATR